LRQLGGLRLKARIQQLTQSGLIVGVNIPITVRRERRWASAGDKPARQLDRSTTDPDCPSGGAILKALLQLRVLGFGLLQDGDVGIGVFPEAK
jgi:hypothetical protein